VGVLHYMFVLFFCGWIFMIFFWLCCVWTAFDVKVLSSLHIAQAKVFRKKENTKYIRWTCFTFQLLCLIIHTPYRFKISTGSQIAISPVGSVHIRILIFSLITVTHMHIFYVYVCFTNNNNNNIFYILYIYFTTL